MSLSLSQQRELLGALHRLAAEREAAERKTLTDFDAATVQARRDLSDGRQTAIGRFQRERDTTQKEYDDALAKAESEYASTLAAAEKEKQKKTTQATARFTEVERQAQEAYDELAWEANTVFEATQNAPQQQLQHEEAQIAMVGDALQQYLDQADGFLVSCRMGHVRSEPPPRIETPPLENPNERLNQRLQDAAMRLQQIKSLVLPKMIFGGTPWGLAVLIWVVSCGVAFLAVGHESSTWLIAGSAIAVIVIVGGVIWVLTASTAMASGPYRALLAAVAESRELRRRALEQAKHKAAAEAWRITQRRDNELRAAQEQFEARTADTATARDNALRAARDVFQKTAKELTEKRDAALAQAHATYPQRLETAQQQYQTELRAAQERFDASTVEVRRVRDETWKRLVDEWQQGAERLRASIDEDNLQDQQLFPAWTDPAWNTWSPPTTPPPSLHFGQMHVELQDIPGAISSEPQLNGILPAKFQLPALLPFPQNASLLFKATGNGRQRAIDALQAVMLRMLTAVPPGKVRFTIIDPVGLGENFAGFMHLADHDEQLVTSRIWTEPPHIEQRLADLSEQMEHVIQKYLRNEFRSIDEYNAFAGEVAEPFRILVVANFPVNFTETAARRLTSIVSSGARCGVYTLIVHDANQPLPPRFDLKEIEQHAVVLAWDGQKFVWQDPDFAKYPLTLESPPGEELFTRLVHTVGRQSKDAKRVEVPFEIVAPARENWWSGDTSGGVRVALGRAGATKLQYLKLGEGTAQHVLIAGKTGSGKSTLLHALITNAALIYSPDQLELYLIDFKKGVEFKTYATYRLPHARVIAIESEREFGLSVLEKLDAELKRRGDLFRQAGVQDVAGYRRAAPDQPMPRILLIVDEFQELFTDDDKLAQDAALLLDRLVRQGRAFGMHVLLGSQTLGGAYSLARSTIGQMAVRIALQCSEADAHLILSEENSAARLLSRPGEAIYNDANGLLQGNNPFQTVWLSEAKREQYLEELQRAAADKYAGAGRPAPPPPIVFEGNVPADLERNRPLADLLQAADWPVRSVPVHAWLGDAIAIKDPTAAVFRPQSGANLLIVGQREQGALGMLASALVSLAAQHRPTAAGAKSTPGFAAGSAARFYVLEHDRPADRPIDHPLADHTGGLAAFASVLPHPLQSASRRDLIETLREIAAEVDRRQSTDDRRAAATYLFISDLGRFRDLRRDEGDLGYSFGGGDKPASPAQMLSTIIRDGPPVGVYTLTWCDSLTAINRAFDRQTVREFALRVLMQMSANDSSHLIDTPMASKLGPHVAIFHNEEEGRLEKFRPYAWPALEWLLQLQERLQSRASVAPE